MPIDPVSDLPVGLSMALSTGRKGSPLLGLSPLERQLHYIGRSSHGINIEDIWELIDGLPPEDTPWSISP